MEFREKISVALPPGWMVREENWGKMLKPEITRLKGFE